LWTLKPRVLTWKPVIGFRFVTSQFSVHSQ